MANNQKPVMILEENPYKLNGRQYIVWLLLGGFMSIGGLFFAATILVISIFGVGMSTQIFDLANYIFSGGDVHVEPNRDAAKTKNMIWAILFGWWFYILHMFFYGLFYITYFGRKIANKWKEQAKLVLFPFGVDLRVREK